MLVSRARRVDGLQCSVMATHPQSQGEVFSFCSAASRQSFFNFDACMWGGSAAGSDSCFAHVFDAMALSRFQFRGEFVVVAACLCVRGWVREAIACFFVKYLE